MATQTHEPATAVGQSQREYLDALYPPDDEGQTEPGRITTIRLDRETREKIETLLSRHYTRTGTALTMSALLRRLVAQEHAKH